MARMVNGFEGHSAGEGTVANHGHGFEIFALGIAGDRHTQRRRNTRGSVACTKVVKLALTALEISRNAILLAQGIKSIVASRQQLMGIGLVPHIPDYLVAIEI